MAGFARKDGRKANELRPVRITPHYVSTADGSCLIEMGQTRVICTALFEPGVPEWLKGKGTGWVTAEYGMLPASTGRRKKRPIGHLDGRASEIQRLIGRCLRSVVAMDNLGENSFFLDCDVLTADGGTRTASITGSYVALALAVAKRQAGGQLPGKRILRGKIAAVSVGMVGGKALLDLDYSEDVGAEVDMNVAQVTGGKFVEVQGTSEHKPFNRAQLNRMLALAGTGIRKLMAAQEQAIRKGLK